MCGIHLHPTSDPDGFSAEPVLIFNDYTPTDPKRKWFHQHQGFYLVIIISGYWLSSVFDLHQVWDLRDKGALNVGISLENSWIKSKARYAVTLRLLHILLNLVVPLYKSPTFTTLNHINLLGISGSLALGLLCPTAIQPPTPEWAPPPIPTTTPPPTTTTTNHNRCAGLNPRSKSPPPTADTSPATSPEASTSRLSTICSHA